MQKISLYFILILSVLSCNAQQHEHTNALINETSPYLLQHAHNPVNWNPWNEATLAKAKEENKMLVISVGYAACHWCHVMEDESFEDEMVAELMNANFISIKVDREERPDVDAIYMSACQWATGEACGWPLNVFALPDGRPVWAGTYFPKKQWLEILEYFVKLYQEEPQKLNDYAVNLTNRIQTFDELEPFVEQEDAGVDFDQIQAITDTYMSAFDDQKGGEKGAPKFPIANRLEFLMQWHYYTDNQEALDLLNISLEKMASGGIYDHLGGGFARYSTDIDWKVPHFEKMLYDNSQLVSLYAQAYALTQKEQYKKVVQESLAFVERELSNQKGGFYSSLDADSDGEEGKFYVWTSKEIDEVVGKTKEAETFKQFYQIKESGNWEEEKNILFHTQSLADFAAQEGLDLQELETYFKQIEEKLLGHRENRTRPGLDDKILTSWNALMLQGYIDAYRYLGEASYLEGALESADFLTREMKLKDGQLFRTYKDGTKKINAFLDDYAFLAQALINLYQVSFDERWLKEAKILSDYAIKHFYDPEKRIFNYTSDLDPQLIAQKVELVDKIIPGSNSVMGEVLYQLSLFVYDQEYQQIVKDMLQQMQTLVFDEENVNFYSNWLQLYLMMSKEPYEVAIVGKDYKGIQKEFQMKYLPNALFLGGADEGNLALLESKLQKGETFIYVCKNRLCKLPVQAVNAALEQM